MPALHVVTHVLLTGPRHTAAAIMALTTLAGDLRRRGAKVTTPMDLARECGATWGSVEFARAKARCILGVDYVVLAPGWEGDLHARTTKEQAEAFDVPVRYHPAALVDESVGA